MKKNKVYHSTLIYWKCFSCILACRKSATLSMKVIKKLFFIVKEACMNSFLLPFFERVWWVSQGYYVQIIALLIYYICNILKEVIRSVRSLIWFGFKVKFKLIKTTNFILTWFDYNWKIELNQTDLNRFDSVQFFNYNQTKSK